MNSMITTQPLTGTAKTSDGRNTRNPSPSGDPWWDDERNVAMVERGAEQIRHGLGKELSLQEIDALLGV